MQDLRYTLRTLRRDRGFTLIAILILALGIGANIAVFSVVDTLMLRPLPLRDPARLLWIGPEVFDGNWSAATYSIDAYQELRRAQQVLHGRRRILRLFLRRQLQAHRSR